MKHKRGKKLQRRLKKFGKKYGPKVKQVYAKGQTLSKKYGPTMKKIGKRLNKANKNLDLMGDNNSGFSFP